MKTFSSFALAASLIAVPAAPSWSKDIPWAPRHRPHATKPLKIFPTQIQAAIEPTAPEKTTKIVFSQPSIDKNIGSCTFEQTNPNNFFQIAIAAIGDNVGAYNPYKDGDKDRLLGIPVQSGFSFISTKSNLYYVIVDPYGSWTARPSNPNADTKTLAAVSSELTKDLPDLDDAARVMKRLGSECSGALAAIPIRFPAGRLPAIMPQPL